MTIVDARSLKLLISYGDAVLSPGSAIIGFATLATGLFQSPRGSRFMASTIFDRWRHSAAGEEERISQMILPRLLNGMIQHGRENIADLRRRHHFHDITPHD